jgi:PAS domain S-box-containing protein
VRGAAGAVRTLWSLSDVVSAEVDTPMMELREAAALRQRTENSLHDSEARFRTVFEFSSAGMIETACDTGRFLSANAAMCRLVGYSKAELLARTAYDITHPDERARDREAFQRLLAGALPVFDVEKRFIRNDGKPVWVRMVANVIRDACGRPLRNIAVILDISERKLAEQDLQVSKDGLQFALDAAQLGWWRYDPRRRMTSGDARFKEILRIAKDEMPIEEIVGLVHPDDREAVWANIQASLDPTRPRPSAMEHRLQRSDGERRWVETHWLPYFEGADGERRAVSVVGTMQDITGRKEREEKEHLLMREINHRAKNMLSVVDAIAHQTAAKNPEDFIERFSERIQALSANQDLLVRNEWKGVAAEDLVRAQLAHFADLIGARIAMQGPVLRLNPAAAQAIGLALHELATNAGKYGALSTENGHVDVGWGTDGKTFTISWTERHGPPVSSPRRRGFGTVVMEAMAERSVGGSVALDYAPSGVTWRLTCPAANAVEPGWGMVRN